jgi:hypothetical protein
MTACSSTPVIMKAPTNEASMYAYLTFFLLTALVFVSNPFTLIFRNPQNPALHLLLIYEGKSVNKPQMEVKQL